jgi:hypothetical protein
MLLVLYFSSLSFERDAILVVGDVFTHLCGRSIVFIDLNTMRKDRKEDNYSSVCK